MRLGAKMPMKIRVKFYKLAGLKIGSSTRITSGFYIDEPKRCHIGSNCFINHFCHIHNGAGENAQVAIDDNVFIGPDVKFICATHEIGDKCQRAGETTYAPIKIEKGAWIGAGAIILPGVTVAQGEIIGAGAVVIKDTKANSLYAGVPAKYIKNYK